MEHNETTNSRKLISWLAIIAIAGIVVYAAAGNKGTDATEPVATKEQLDSASSASAYTNGTYSATGVYNSPGGAEELGVTLTLAGGIVTDSTVTPMATIPASINWQQKFAADYKQYVVGKPIDEINVPTVSGSSLTPDGFNDALVKIKAQARG